MWPLSLHESIGGSVMTKRSGGRVHQLSRYLPQSQPPCQASDLTSSSSSSSSSNRTLSLDCVGKVSRLSPDSPTVGVTSTQTRRSTISRLRSQGARWIDGLTKVGIVRVRCALVLLLLLSLHSHVVMGKPRNTEHPHQITFESRFCRPVSVDHLRSRMGRHYDERKMASDIASAKRQFRDTRGYQGDDPFAGNDRDELDRLVDEESLRSSGEVWIREEEMVEDDDTYDDDGEVRKKEELEFELDVKDDDDKGEEEEEEDEEEEDEEEEEEEEEEKKEGEDRNERRHRLRRTWLPRRRILGSHRRDEGRFGVSDVRFGKDGTNSDSEKPDSFNGYMRRRRRRSPAQSIDPKGSRLRSKENNQNRTDNSGERTRDDKMSNFKSSKKSSKNRVPLLLVLGGKKRRKNRKKLRKEFRQRARKHNRPPPWQCKFRHKAVIMKETVFPRLIRDGECMSDKCFYRLYNCEPIKYAIKVLKRDPDHCNPLPLEGNFTTYEERWNQVSRHINVGCSCSSLAESSRSKNRRTK